MNYQFVAPEKMLPSMLAQKVPLFAFDKDAVAIVLSNDLSVDPAPLAKGLATQPGLQLAHVAYPADRRFMPAAQFDCHLLASDAVDPLWLNDCDTHPGSSGGPLFVKVNGTYKVAAIMVGAGAGGANVALPTSEWLNLTQDAKCP